MDEYEIVEDEKETYVQVILEKTLSTLYAISLIVGIFIALLFFPISIPTWIVYSKVSSKRMERQCKKKHQLRQLREQIEFDSE